MKWFERKNLRNMSISDGDSNGDGPVRPYPTDRSLRSNHVFLYTLLVLLVTFSVPAAFVQSAPVVFIQNDWSTKSDSPAETPPFTSWSSYSAIDNDVSDGSDIQLQENNYSVIQESDDGSTDTCSASDCDDNQGGFNLGTTSGTTVFGTGSAASVRVATIAASKKFMNQSYNWLSNPGPNSNPEQITAVAVDSNSFYMAGFDSSAGNDEQWRIEKRLRYPGTLDSAFDGDGIVQSNASSGADRINAMAIDATHIYVAGFDSDGQNSSEQWRIEKRDIVTGALVGAFDTDGIVLSDPSATAGSEQITAMAIDATHIYVAGFDSDGQNSSEQWRIEKRDIVTGALISAFDTDGIVLSDPFATAGSERIMSVAIDAAHIYVAGFDNVPGNSQWRIEKRDIVTGALIGAFDTDGIVQSNLIGNSERINAMAIDAAHIYVAGFDSDGLSSSEQWRIEKRDIVTGALIGAFDTDGVVISDDPTNTGSEKIMSIAVDGDYIFTAGYGYDDNSSQPRWKIECRNIGDGSLVTAFGDNGILMARPNTVQDGAAKINDIALMDDRYLYVGGYDNEAGGGNGEQWLLRKLIVKEFIDGPVTFESAVIDLGAVVNNFNTFVWSPTSPPDNTALSMKVRAGTVATPDGSWTSWTSVTNNAGSGAFSGNRYVQYQATMSTSNEYDTPKLEQFSIDFSNFPSGAGLVSSVFDTGNSNSFLKTISWTETLGGYDVRLQVATSGNGETWNYCGLDAAACSTTDWLDWDASANNYYTDNTGDLLHLNLSDADDDRYFKYKVWLSGDGSGSPTADDVSINFDTAHLGVFAPDGTSTTYEATAGTSFDVKVKVRDSSGALYTGHDHATTIKLIASSSQPSMGSCTSSFVGGDNTEYSVGNSYSSGVMTLSVTLCQSTETSFTIRAVETSGGVLVSNSDLTVTRVGFDSSTKKLVFTTQPARNGIMGEDINPAPIVSIQDQYGNVNLLGTDSITLSAKSENADCSTAANGTLSIDSSSVTAVAGVSAFSGISYDTPETIYLRADASGITYGCSESMIIDDAGFVVQIDAVYDLTNDAIVVSTSFLEKGAIVNDAAVLLSEIDIQDDALTSVTGGPFTSGSGTDVSTVTDGTNKVFHTTWDPSAGLTADATYTIFSKIDYNGTSYTNSKPFKVGQLGTIKSKLGQLDTSLDGVKTTVASIDASAVSADTAVASLDTKITAHAAAQAAYRAQTTTAIAGIKTKIGSILEDTSKTVSDAIKTTVAAELAKGDFTEIITTQAEVKTGTTLPFRYRTISGLKPTVTVLDPKEAGKIQSAPMKEIGGTGVYVYNITFKTIWGLGNFMISVDESTKQSVDRIVLEVTEDKEEVAAKAVASSAVTLDTLYSRVNSIGSNMSTLTSGVNTVKSNTDNVSSDIDALLDEVDGGSSSTAALAGDAAKFGKYINSVSSIIGSSGSTTDFGTILGKLNGIESTLDDMGGNADVAMNFNETAKEKTDRIKKFVNLIMAEIKEDGSVEDASEKAEILGEYLADLKSTVKEIPSAITNASVAESVEETLEELNNVTVNKEGLEGIMLLVDGEYEKTSDVQFAEDLSPVDVQEMRNDVSGLKSLMVEIRGLLDTEVNQPVVHGWLEGE